jgi:hypothetical protein
MTGAAGRIEEDSADRRCEENRHVDGNGCVKQDIGGGAFVERAWYVMVVILNRIQR